MPCVSRSIKMEMHCTDVLKFAAGLDMPFERAAGVNAAGPLGAAGVGVCPMTAAAAAALRAVCTEGRSAGNVCRTDSGQANGGVLCC